MSGGKKIYIQVQYPSDTSGVIETGRLDDLLLQLHSVFKGFEVTLQSEEVTDAPNGASNGHTRSRPVFTPSYCKTSQGSGNLVPTVLIALHYVEACPSEEAVEKMKEFVAKCVFGDQQGPHRVEVMIHPAIRIPGSALT